MSDLDQMIRTRIDARESEDGAAKVERALEDIANAVRDTAREVDRSGDKMDDSFDDIGKSAEDSAGSIDLFKAGFAFTAAIASVAALGLAVEAVAGNIDEIGKLSSQVNVTTGFFQTLEFGASQSNIELATVTNLLRDLTKNTGLAAGGSKPLVDAFDKIGVSIRNAAGEIKSVEELFPQVQAGLQGLGSDAERAAIGMALMGESSLQATNLLKPGAKTLEEYAKQAADLGIILDEDTFEAAANVTDQIDILSRVIQAEFGAALKDLAPLILGTISGLVTLTTSTADLVARFGLFVGLVDELDPNKLQNALSQTVVDNAAALTTQIEGLTTALANLPDGSDAAIAAQKTLDGLKEQLVVQEKLLALDAESTPVTPVNTIAEVVNDSPDEDAAVKAFEKEQLFRELNIAADKVAIATKLNDEATAAENRFANLQVELAVEENLRSEVALNRSLALEESLLSQEEIRANFLENEQATVASALARGVITEEKAEKLKTSIKDRELKKRTLLELNAASTILGSISTVANAFADSSETAFNIAKGVAVAEAVVNTATGATKAYAQGGVFGFIGAAAVIAAGTAQIANILATRPGSSGSVTSTSGGIGISNAQQRGQINDFGQNAFTPGNQSSGRTVQLNVTINGFTNKDSVENDIIPSLRELLADGETLFDTDSAQSTLILQGT